MALVIKDKHGGEDPGGPLGFCENPKCPWGHLDIRLNADHKIPRSNFRIIRNDPTNGQVLCQYCNGEKGSIHMDFQPLATKMFYARAADQHWEQEPLRGRWILNKEGHAWLNSQSRVLAI